MKKLLVVVALSCFTLGVQAQFTQAELQATGLTCAMCNNAINKALEALPFVASVKSDIKHSSFHISFKSDAALDIDALKKAVENAGFSVGSLKLTGNFSDVKVAPDKHVEMEHMVFHFLNTPEQVLNGERTIQVVDKNFVTMKQFKKWSSTTTMSCLQTGKAEACCEKDSIPANTRVYHVVI